MEFEITVEFDNFLDSLLPKEKAKLMALIERIEQYGFEVSQKMKWTKKLEDNLYEIRSEFGGNHSRGIYFHYQNGVFIITNGFRKKTNKTPQREISKAKKMREHILEEKQ